MLVIGGLPAGGFRRGNIGRGLVRLLFLEKEADSPADGYEEDNGSDDDRNDFKWNPGCRLHPQATDLQDREEQGSQQDADGAHAAQKGNGHAVPADVQGSRLGEVVLVSPQTLYDPAQATEGTWQEHGDDDVLLVAHAGVTAGEWVQTNRLDFKADRGLLHQEPEDDQGNDGQEDTTADPGAAEHFAQPRNPQAAASPDGLGSVGVNAEALVHDVLVQVLAKVEDDVVKHDGWDNFVSSEVGPQPAGNPGNQGTGQAAGDDFKWQEDVDGQALEGQADPDGGQPAGLRLARQTDVEEASGWRDLEADGDKDQRGGVTDGFPDPVGWAQGTFKHWAVGLEWVIAPDQHDDGPD